MSVALAVIILLASPGRWHVGTAGPTAGWYAEFIARGATMKGR